MSTLSLQFVQTTFAYKYEEMQKIEVQEPVGYGMKGLQVMLYERHNHIRQPQYRKIPPRVNLLQTSEVFP